MKKTIITIALITVLILSCTFACIRQINSKRDIINAVLEYYPDYRVEVLKDDPNQLLIRIEK